MTTTPGIQSETSRFDDAIGAGLLAGGANVIMQLSWPGVGYGVVESKVQSGSIYRRPTGARSSAPGRR